MESPEQHILVVDDEPDIRSLVQEILIDEGFEVSVAENANQARKIISESQPTLILLDIWMPEIDGITLLKELKENNQLATPIIMMSGHGNVETAVEATRHGAYDFIEKPLSIAKLLLTIKHALETTSLQQENIKLSQFSQTNFEPIGKSKKITELRKQIETIANHDKHILIFGESGTDKERYAHYLHSISHRQEGPFVTVSISSLEREHAESELFGLETGSQIKKGYFDKAQGGTLFIKDIGELESKLQARLQAVVENKSYSPVGSSKENKLDIRIIAATRYDLADRVKQGLFRDDLYYQLNILPIRIPALREHYEDIPELLEFYINHFINTEGFHYRHFDVAAQNRLRSYDWPGNIRELKNLIQRMLILGSDSVISLKEVEKSLGKIDNQNDESVFQGFDFDMPLREARDSFEKAYLEYQLKKADGSVSKVANAVGMERTHLYRKMKNLGIELK